jgi:hypothetical protein
MRQELTRQRMKKLTCESTATCGSSNLPPTSKPEKLTLLKDFAGLWQQMMLTGRRAILQTMFTGLYFDADGQLRKSSANSPFDRLLGLVVQKVGISVKIACPCSIYRTTSSLAQHRDQGLQE